MKVVENEILPANELLDPAIPSVGSLSAGNISVGTPEAVISTNEVGSLSTSNVSVGTPEVVISTNEAVGNSSEPRRPKTHWDHVLDEMVWLSKDFESVRKWKLAQAKKLARRASKGMMDQAARGEKKVCLFPLLNVELSWISTYLLLCP